VRIGFLDESGRSKYEPSLVVAGVIVHGDRSYRAIRDHLLEIATQHIPLADRDGFIFHATDIFHGAGYFKDKETWEPPKRFAILRELAAIPAKFSLPVVFGNVRKGPRVADIIGQIMETAKTPVRRQQYVLDATMHGTAFAMAETAVEFQMKAFPRDEICMLVAEDTDLVKKAMRLGHTLLERPHELAKMYPQFARYRLPVTRIVEGPYFKAKSESAPLQVADTCAFIVAHRLRRDEKTQEFFELFSQQIVISSPDFGEKMGNETIGGGQRI